MLGLLSNCLRPNGLRFFGYGIMEEFQPIRKMTRVVDKTLLTNFLLFNIFGGNISMIFNFFIFYY